MNKLLFIPFLILVISSSAQKAVLKPDLSKVTEPRIWTSYNRLQTYDGVVHLNAKEGDGFLRLNGVELANGKIELDIKGKDEAGMSFVGVAFHGLNDSTYDAIYFRPFNFKHPTRNDHSVQYISHPEFTWNKLRDEHPGKYESAVVPVPDPSGWFHAVVVIAYPMVSVFVNNSGKPSLSIKQRSLRRNGWIALWVGYNADGDFKNLKISRD